MGCGLKATNNNFNCSSLNAFKEITVSSRTIIKNDITIINDGQNICTMANGGWRNRGTAWALPRFFFWAARPPNIYIPKFA